MPSASKLDRVRTWARSPRNVTIVTAILVSFPVAYAFHLVFGTENGGFLLLMTVGVGVPTIYDRHWTPHERAWRAVVWVLVASAVVVAVFVGVYLAAREVTSSLLALVGAFLVAYLGPLVALASR